jgi:hypothetical protein
MGSILERLVKGEALRLDESAPVFGVGQQGTGPGRATVEPLAFAVKFNVLPAMLAGGVFAVSGAGHRSGLTN